MIAHRSIVVPVMLRSAPVPAAIGHCSGVTVAGYALYQPDPLLPGGVWTDRKTIGGMSAERRRDTRDHACRAGRR